MKISKLLLITVFSLISTVAVSAVMEAKKESVAATPEPKAMTNPNGVKGAQPQSFTAPKAPGADPAKGVAGNTKPTNQGRESVPLGYMDGHAK